MEISNKTDYFSYKSSCEYVVIIHTPKCLKEELAWAADKQNWVISNIMLFKTVVPLRN